jgi:maleylpyruvate isomerase
VKLRLHNYWRSSASHRVRIALGWKALPWEYVPVHLTKGGGEQHQPAYLRARARGLAELVNSGIQPLQNLTTTRKVKELGGDDAVWVGGFIADGLRAFETIATASAGRFCVGDAVSIADVFLIPQLFGARRFGVDLEPLPLLCRIEAACNELPAFVAAEPNRQPDAQIAQT